MAQTASDYLLARLADWGVHVVFGYPGNGINELVAAWGRRDAPPRFVQARHEEIDGHERGEDRQDEDGQVPGTRPQGCGAGPAVRGASCRSGVGTSTSVAAAAPDRRSASGSLPSSCPPSLRCKYGFLIQVLGVAFEGERDLAELDTAILAAVPEGQLPHFRESTLEHALQPGYDFGDEFTRGSS